MAVHDGLPRVRRLALVGAEIVWCSQEYMAAGGSGAIVTFYRHRYAAIAMFLNTLGLASAPPVSSTLMCWRRERCFVRNLHESPVSAFRNALANWQREDNPCRSVST